jgi:hypothetical protein
MLNIKKIGSVFTNLGNIEEELTRKQNNNAWDQNYLDSVFEKWMQIQDESALNPDLAEKVVNRITNLSGANELSLEGQAEIVFDKLHPVSDPSAKYSSEKRAAFIEFALTCKKMNEMNLEEDAPVIVNG